MASTFTTSLKFNKPALGDAGWGTAVNGGFTDLADQALGGQASIDVGAGAGPFVLTIPDGASGDARNMFILATGTPGGAREIQVPTNRKLYFVTNDSDGAVTVKVLGQTGVVVPVGASMALRINPAGTDVGPALTYQASMTLGTALAAASGGTGYSSYAVGDLLYADTTTTLAKLASVAEGSVLRAKGVGTAPAWEQVDLTTDVTGVLPAANGGTGLSVFPAPGTLGNVLYSDGADWTAADLATLVPDATDSAKGVVELATTAEIEAGTDTTRAITPAGLRGGALVRMTAQATTSGTVVDFTDIPSWVKRITIMFNEVSLTNNADYIVQLGVVGDPVGTFVTTGYLSSSSAIAVSVSTITSVAGFALFSFDAGAKQSGHMVLTNLSGNIWSQSHVIGRTDIAATRVGGGVKTLTGVLDRVRITNTVTGANAFDNGSVNVIYE